ncbi:MAG: TIGR03663 family protein [Rubrivivax sp.]|nr:TIGR03663 family protein [Pyrinomonadaceae bacterium]
MVAPTAADAVAAPPAPALAPDTAAERTWTYASLGVLLAAAALRMYALELKPMHHDEGVNGFFLTTLVRQGVFKYDPTNYHGPTLYYLTLPSVVLFGLGNFALRLVTAAFGIAIVWLVLCLRRYIGTYGTLAAAALVAVSPGAVFYSRYFIHEMLFVFFALGLVVAALRFHETGRALYLMLAAASAALLFATKETAFVNVGTLALAWLVAWYWAPRVAPQRQRAGAGNARGGRHAKHEEDGEVSARTLSALFGGAERAPRLIVGAVALFLFVGVLFYSSFFTNWEGVGGAIEALKVWSKTGTSDFHGKPFGTYLTLLFQGEAPIFILAATGSAIALFERRKSRFAIFAGAWAFGMLLAYSLIPYKTPWLMLSFTVPMCIAAGYAVQSLAKRSWGGLKAPAPALLVAGLAAALCAYQATVLNFREYDNDQYPYVYAHTHREFHALVGEIERLAESAGTKQLNVTVASPDYWPMPWYFRDNPNVGYVGTLSERYDPQVAPVVIGRESADANVDQTAKLRETLGAEYGQAGIYTLRPGVRLALFARRDLASQGRAQALR